MVFRVGTPIVMFMTNTATTSSTKITAFAKTIELARAEGFTIANDGATVYLTKETSPYTLLIKFKFDAFTSTLSFVEGSGTLYQTTADGRDVRVSAVAPFSTYAQVRKALKG